MYFLYLLNHWRYKHYIFLVNYIFYVCLQIIMILDLIVFTKIVLYDFVNTFGASVFQRHILLTNFFAATPSNSLTLLQIIQEEQKVIFKSTSMKFKRQFTSMLIHFHKDDASDLSPTSVYFHKNRRNFSVSCISVHFHRLTEVMIHSSSVQGC